MKLEHEYLPTVNELNDRLKVLVTMGIVMNSAEDAWLRVHSKVSGFEDEQVYQVDNGAGDSLFIVFADEGCIIKGFDHESMFSPYVQDEFKPWPGIYDDVPQNLLAILDDSMFEKELVTFCIWNEATDPGWKIGDISNPNPGRYHDGRDHLIAYLHPTAADYIDWAQEYYDTDLPLEAIEYLFSGGELTEEIIAGINPDRDAQEALLEYAVL